MKRVFANWQVWGLLGLALFLGATATASAQPVERKTYPLVAKVVPSGEELSSQPRMWIMEVQMKPLRMVQVPFTNPKTGKQEFEHVWYVVYKAINRPLPYKPDTSDTIPLNDDDVEPLPQMFVPVFTLMTDDITDNVPVRKTYQDEIWPAAQAVINARESRTAPAGVTYKNTVEIIQPVPPETPEDQGDANAIYGMAMWRGVDRDTDYLSVYLSGFSNAYRYVSVAGDFVALKQLAQDGDLLPSDSVWDGSEDIRLPSEICNWKASIKAQTESVRDWRSAASVGGLFNDVKAPPAENRKWFYTQTAERFKRDQRPPVWRRTIVQHYSRYGDQLDEAETEFRVCQEPHWIYWPDEDPASLLPALPAAPVTPAQN